MPTIDTSSTSPVAPGYLDTLNEELTAVQESYLSSPRHAKKRIKGKVLKIEDEIERVHALHAERSPSTGPVTYMWTAKGALGIRLQVPRESMPPVSAVR